MCSDLFIWQSLGQAAGCQVSSCCPAMRITDFCWIPRALGPSHALPASYMWLVTYCHGKQPSSLCESPPTGSYSLNVLQVRLAGDRYVLVEYGPMELDLNLRVRVWALQQYLADKKVCPCNAPRTRLEVESHQCRDSADRGSTEDTSIAGAQAA